MEYLYHGSAVGGIRRLRAGSVLHGTDRRAAYLTGSAAYALFYIWDERRAGFPKKHVTAWVADGLAQYEEQFEGQLAAFYQGAAGWLYRVERTAEMGAVQGRESLFYAPGGADVAGAAFIPDVYAALLEEEARGRAKIWRFSQRPAEKREELTAMMARLIAENGFFRGKEEEGFYRRYFREAWQRAIALAGTPGENLM